MRSRKLAVIAVALWACGAPPGRADRAAVRSDASEGAERAPETALDPTSAESVASHMTLPEDVESRRAEYASAIVRGWEIVRSFADENGWAAQAEAPTFDRVEIFSTRADLWSAVLVIYDAPSDTPLPGTGPVAAIEGRILLSVTAEAYARAHPVYAEAPESLARLYAHEMIHRLHVRLLDGDDDAMGPRWFYEGLAVLGSGQDFDMGHVVYESAEEALAGARETAEPTLAYQRYAATLRYFLRHHALGTLVERAGDDGFEDWLSRTSPAPSSH